jgi:hypothetical protein
LSETAYFVKDVIGPKGCVSIAGVKEGEALTYRNIQTYLYKLYVLPEKKKPVTA